MRWNLKGFTTQKRVERHLRKNVVKTSTFLTINGETPMDKDRIQGSFEQAKGKVKEVTGKATGDSKLEVEGKTQKTAGKIQNTVGGIKDTVKDAAD